MNIILIWLSIILIFTAWLTYLLLSCLKHAQVQIQTGTPPDKVSGMHIFPVFPILPGIVSLCLFSFDPPLSIPWLAVICILHAGISLSSAHAGAKIWYWLRSAENKHKQP